MLTFCKYINCFVCSVKSGTIMLKLHILQVISIHFSAKKSSQIRPAVNLKVTELLVSLKKNEDQMHGKVLHYMYVYIAPQLNCKHSRIWMLKQPQQVVIYNISPLLWYVVSIKRLIIITFNLFFTCQIRLLQIELLKIVSTK